MATNQVLKTDDLRVARRRVHEADEPTADRSPSAKELRAGVEAVAAPGADRGRAAFGVASISRLQQAFGNHAVQRLVLQRQAAVQRADGEEEEVQTLRAPVQRQDEEEVQTLRDPVQREGEEEEVQTLRSPVQRADGEEEEVQTLSTAVQRADGEEEEVQTLRASVQREADGEGGDLGTKIRSRSGGGSALEPGVQRWLEDGLGADLSGVRVHTGGEADHMARSVQSTAFTSGRDIYFRDGAYDPGSERGLQTLAHEATHVVQQASGPVAGTPQAGGVSVSDPSDRFEQAAEAQAHDLVSAGTPGKAPGGPVQRRSDEGDAGL